MAMPPIIVLLRSGVSRGRSNPPRCWPSVVKVCTRALFKSVTKISSRELNARPIGEENSPGSKGILSSPPLPLADLIPRPTRCPSLQPPQTPRRNFQPGSTVSANLNEPFLRGRSQVPFNDLVAELQETLNEREQVIAAMRMGIDGPYRFERTVWCRPDLLG